MMAPRRYMRTALCLPISQAITHSELLGRLKLGIRRTVAIYPFLLGSLRVDPCDERKNSLVIDTPKDPLDVARGSIIVSPKYWADRMDYDSLEGRGFPPSQIADAIVRDPHDPVDVKDGCPVFNLQVVFIRNGIILSICLHHSLADGPTFSEVVENIVSGLDQEPVSADPVIGFHLHLDSFESTLETGDPQELIKLCPDRMFRDEMERTTELLRQPLDLIPPVRCKIFQYGLSSLLGIRIEILNAMTNAQTSGHLASANDCIGAYLWAHVTRARLANKPPSAKPKESRLFVPVDFRPRIKPKVPQTYFGNAIITVPVTMSISVLIAACGAFNSYNGKRALAKVALAIREASDAVNEEYVRRRLNLGKSLPDMRAVRLNFNAIGTIDMIFNNLAALDAGLTKSTFAARQGKRIAMRPLATDMAANVGVMLPRLDSVVELVLGLYEDDMEELLATKSWMRLVKQVIE
ncbi:hypothetical protein FDECE_2840 [Fusarium decemcellulare]|nr:hypothetical protein FDECE_2840 [Fusarium decemcellulare]